MDKVMVCVVYTKYKEYCRFLYPRIVESLTYKNKVVAFIDEDHFPELLKEPTGEQVAARGRQIGIDTAKRYNCDWILFLDIDTEPDTDIIEKLLAVNHCLVGGMHAARGNSWKIIGHNYKNRKTLERIWLNKSDMKDNPYVDGISGGTLLVAKGIFNRVDYDGYEGPNTILGRFTADDEYLQIKIYNSLKIRPKVCTTARSWHYSEDGRAYKVWGEVKQWRKF